MIARVLPPIVLVLAAAGGPRACPEPDPGASSLAAQELSATSTPAPTPVAEAVSDDPGIRLAIERALVVLQADGDAWMEGRAPFQDGSGCVSCHQVPYGLWGLKEAARAGIVADAGAAADLERRAFEFVARPGIGRPMSWSPLALALGGEGGLEAGAVDDLLGAQRAAGNWEARGQFPAQRRELTETNAVATMFTILALSAAAESDETVAASLERARGWVSRRGPGESTEWLVLRALVEGEVGAAASGLLARLVDQQNADGGWSWKPGEKSNAMSTGEALWALSLAAADSTNRPRAEAVRRGIEYLVAGQGADGWWRVASDLTSKGREESKDYVYDYWGTAWATIGLARWLRIAQVTALLPGASVREEGSAAGRVEGAAD